MYALQVIDLVMEPPRSDFRSARVGALEEAEGRVSSRSRHPWRRRPDPLAVAAALTRGLRSGSFSEADIQIVAHEAACVALAHVMSRGFNLDDFSPELGYGIPGELFAGYPECPFLQRYLGELVSSGEPDPMHLVRRFRKTVRTYAHHHLLGLIGSKYIHEKLVRRQVRNAAAELHIAQKHRRLLFVPERRGPEPLSRSEHLSALSRACRPGATVGELVSATRTILEKRRDVAGWLEIYDLVNDYLAFFAAPFASVQWGVALDDTSRQTMMNECRAMWLQLRGPMRRRFLGEWGGSPEVAQLDFEAFCQLMAVFFETGRYEDRWIHWTARFPDEIHSNEEFRDSRHRRRADALWRELRRAFRERLGREPGLDARPDGEAP